MRPLACLPILVACSTQAPAAPRAAPEPAPPEIVPTPEAPLPFSAPDGGEKMSSSTFEGTRTVVYEIPGEETASIAWAKGALGRLGCRQITTERPWEEVELRCADRPGASAVVAKAGAKTTVVVTWTELPDAVDVGE